MSHSWLRNRDHCLPSHPCFIRVSSVAKKILITVSLLPSVFHSVAEGRCLESVTNQSVARSAGTQK